MTFKLIEWITIERIEAGEGDTIWIHTASKAQAVRVFRFNTYEVEETAQPQGVTVKIPNAWGQGRMLIHNTLDEDGHLYFMVWNEEHMSARQFYLDNKGREDLLQVLLGVKYRK